MKTDTYTTDQCRSAAPDVDQTPLNVCSAMSNPVAPETTPAHPTLPPSGGVDTWTRRLGVSDLRIPTKYTPAPLTQVTDQSKVRSMDTQQHSVMHKIANHFAGKYRTLSTRDRSLEKEDLYQLVYAEMLRVLPQYDPTRGALSTYLVPHARGACSNLRLAQGRQKRARGARVGLETLQIPTPDCEGQIDLDRAVRRESDPRRRKIFTLVAEGYQYTEIGKQLGISRERVRQILGLVEGES